MTPSADHILPKWGFDEATCCRGQAVAVGVRKGSPFSLLTMEEICPDSDTVM